ncbi:MAG: restriction endonuclease subunit S [Pseudomonas sp.]|uniref:restriction endonuclease subunit S n=1 Tax=Pseudomonas sp. TaxID=306 RepID=UPI003D0F15B0
MLELPRGWAEARLDELASVNPKQEFDDELTAGFVPMAYAPTNFQDKLRFDERNWGDIKKAYTNFKDGDVIFAKVTPCFENGKAALVAGLPNGIGAGSSEFFVLRPSTLEVSAKYLLAVIKSHDFMKNGAFNMTGAVGLRRVPRQFVESFVVAVPPAAEQIRITKRLDELLTRVHTLKINLDAIQLLLKRFRQSVLAAATKGGLTELWRERQSLSFEWPRENFSSLISEFKSGASATPSDSPHGVPIVRSSAVRSMAVDFLDIRHFDFDTDLNERDYIKKGDLLFTRLSGSAEFVGMCARVKTPPKIPTQFPDRLFCARLKNIDFAPYLELFFSSKPFLDHVRKNLKSSAGHQRITTDVVKNAWIPLPPLDEQTEIVRRVEQLFAFADQLEAKVAAAKTRIDQLTQSILAKAFRGELVPQDPDDEPASVLLERIKAQRVAAPKATRKKKAN